MSVLSPEDIAARIALQQARLALPPLPPEAEEELAALRDGSGLSPVSEGSMDPVYRHYVPLSAAADEYVRWARAPQRRIYTGIPEFDDAMRGTAPGELTLVQGFAHSGKTVFVTQVMLNNRNRRVVLFTPDETRPLVLIKMVSVLHGISAEELEERISGDDPEAIDLVRQTATRDLPHLAVFDDISDIRSMHNAMDELRQHWGADPELVIFDYADLLVGAGEDTKGRIDAIKAFGKVRQVPMYLLHQSSRTGGADGKKVTLTSGAYGGEQQATHVVGVRRKKSEILARIEDLRVRIKASVKDPGALQEQLNDAEYELRQHQHTITFNLVKNKRPPSRLVDDVDFELDQNTGQIRKLGFKEFARQRANAVETWDEPAFEDF